MKALILGSSNSRNAGGVFNSMRMLGKSLLALNTIDIQYLLHDDEYSVEDRVLYEPIPLHTYTIKGPGNFAYSKDIYDKLIQIKPDIIHTQGIWMYFSYINKKYHANTKTPYVISPHGMLDAWQLKQSFSKDLKKRLVLRLYERQHLEKAACIQALCISEYEAIRAFGLKNPVAIIPNGTELPSITQRDHDYPVKPRWSQTEKRKTLLFLSRIHHKKGLDNLLKAWMLSNPAEHNWRLVIAGETKDPNYMNSLLEQSREFGITDTVEFIGGQFGKDKETCFIDADAFILPSFSEGLPMAVLEAWSYKLPVLITPYCNLPEGFEKNAAIKIEPDPESIAQGIKMLVSITEAERSQLGANGSNLIEEKFTWEKVAQATEEMYKWILEGTEKPEFIKYN